MRQVLTPQQRSVFDFISSFISANGYAPCRREIAEHFGYSSLNAATWYVDTLVKRGWLRRDRSVRRGLRLTEELKTQYATVRPGAAVSLGDFYVGCVSVNDRDVRLELIAPEELGEVIHD